MSGSDTSSTAVKPLTKRRKDTQELYHRRPEVERQIEQVCSLKCSQILEFLQTNEREEPHYLFDETIVYLLRERRAEGDSGEIEALFLILNARIRRLLKGYRRKFVLEADFEDFGQKIITWVITNIFDLDSEKADFAQINFGAYIITEAKGLRNRKLTATLKENERFVPREEDKVESVTTDQIVAGRKAFEKKLAIKEAIDKLPDHLITVVVLLADGWKIESKNEAEPTIAKYLGVSSRTIRNWVNEARELLEEYEGELS